MKYKQEDIGLYFALILIGGGVGLLAGAALANYLEKRREEKSGEEKMAENEYADEEWVAKEKAAAEEQAAQESHEELMAAQAEEIIEDQQYGEKDLDEAKWSLYSERSEEIIEKAPKKRNERRPNLSQYTDEELEDFIAEHEPNIQMMEMLRNGGMTMEQVRGVIQLEEDALNQEPVDYNKPYFEAAVAEVAAEGESEPEELEEAIDDLGVVNERFQLLTAPPKNAAELSRKEIQWDPEDNSFVLLRKGHPIIYDIRTSIGHDTWEVAVPYMLRGLTDIYIVDLENPRYYAFHKLVGLGEDDPPNDGSE